MTQGAPGRARAADERAFRELTEPHRRGLLVHCYRMLGSLTDAEDVLQETMLAAWRGLDGFEGRSSVRTWLYRIATNRCLNALRDAGRRRPPEPRPPFEPPPPSRRSDVTWLQPIPDHLLTDVAEPAPGPEARYGSRESVELAFVAGLQRLPPRQAAALVLCDVLGFSLAEAADMLGGGPTAVKGALQRARAGTAARHGEPPAPSSPEEKALVRRFAEAFTADDVDGVVELLTDDGWLAMPPAPHEYHGRAAVAAFLTVSMGWSGRGATTLLPTRANTQPAFGCYLGGRPAGLIVLTLRGDRIATITRFLEADFPRLGLPATPGAP
ncbi:RNA polymerase subunit sigma-70 [Pseudonocardia sp. TRM90224]|uniref:RNA polymerase subunit sigma-70 n=1 Tax=Pseudonocardia sp. TRM90224 TaxID=2812678 RepID=UPI001E45C2CD|nr:RNA polymerase subunit sigma-70 [Pseudonocardia sp. TRM90224]